MKMIRNAVSKYDDYSILLKIRQSLLQWGYELTEKDFLMSWQIKKNIVNEKWEMRNEKWEMKIELWISKQIFFLKLSNQYMKMNYYWFNKQEILQKAKENYSKEKAAKYYKQNKEAIKEKSRERYKNLLQEQKDKIKEYQKKKSRIGSV